MPDWNATQYLKFDRERTRPARDLASRIEFGEPKNILDVGCGPGNSTEVLAQRFPSARILGIDRSPNMIAAARMRIEQFPQMRFEVCDAGTELKQLPADFDVVFSNACIQWIPGHAALLPAMLSRLRPDGILAVQTPMNYDEPIHKIIMETVTGAKWISRFQHPRIFYNLTPDEYYDILAKNAASFNVWQTTYFHTMRSHADILEWYRGTGLRPYLEALPEAETEPFENEILKKLTASYTVQKNGDIIFRFPRFFFTAVAR